MVWLVYLIGLCCKMVILIIMVMFVILFILIYGRDVFLINEVFVDIRFNIKVKGMLVLCKEVIYKNWKDWMLFFMIRSYCRYFFKKRYCYVRWKLVWVLK